MTTQDETTWPIEVPDAGRARSSPPGRAGRSADSAAEPLPPALTVLTEGLAVAASALDPPVLPGVLADLLPEPTPAAGLRPAAKPGSPDIQPEPAAKRTDKPIDKPTATGCLASYMLRSVDAKPVGGRSKRWCDICLALLALAMAIPVLILLVGAQKVASPGPVLFAHPRVGFRGRSFRCYKLRTMVPDSAAVLQRHLACNPEAALEWERTQKLQDDPRVTAFGRLMRRSSLDELPQLFNILRGDMSCVGPRPVVHDEVMRYGEHALDYLRARPGLTGAWQVNRLSCENYDRRVALDVEYVQGWSFLKDVRIVLRTIPVLLRQEGSV